MNSFVPNQRARIHVLELDYPHCTRKFDAKTFVGFEHKNLLTTVARNASQRT